MQPHATRHLSFNLSKANRAKRRHFARVLAYILRSIVTDPRTGRRYDYTGEGGIIASGVVGWQRTKEALVEEVVFSEKRSDAVEGRVIIAALPSELSEKTHVGLLEKLACHLYENYRVASVYALHRPDPEGDPRNAHAHIIFTSREVDESGDSLGQKTRAWDTSKGRELLEELRAWWCALMNEALLAAGFSPNLEHKSFVRLGIDRTPGRHRGEKKTALMRRKAKLEASQQPMVPVAAHSAITGELSAILEPELVVEGGLGVSRFQKNQPWPQLNAPPVVAVVPKRDMPKPVVEPVEQPEHETIPGPEIHGNVIPRPPLNAPRPNPKISPKELQI